jgi:hypothetical protein
MRKSFFLGALFIASAALPAQKISFFAEDLHFTLTENKFEVDGLYYFRNQTNQCLDQVLFYPFPEINEYGEIIFININSHGDTTQPVLRQRPTGAIFKLELKPFEEKAYRINYAQRPVSGKAKYIITTTGYWNRPFEIAKYSLTYPQTISIDSTSLPPDSILFKKDKIIYYWEKTDFMPDKDFYFEFHEK